MTHQQIEKWMLREFSNRGHLVNRQERLAISKDDYYKPDITLRDSTTKAITHIIEIEKDPTRKAVVGAAILADYCMRLLKQDSKPCLIFAIYGTNGKAQISHFQKRAEVARDYRKLIEIMDPVLFSTEDFGDNVCFSVHRLPAY